MMLSMIRLCWQTFMCYFGVVMDLAEESRFVMLMISCVMAVAFILNVQSGWAVFHELERRMTNKRIGGKPTHYPSPVHIVSSGAYRRQMRLPLLWTHYDDTPLAVLLENNGNTVVMRTCWPPNSMPHLSGGELGGRYHFVEAIFKWGVKSAEHTIDGHKISLEMQVLHLCVQQKKYLALSYLFVLYPCKNGPLRHITDNLKHIGWPGSSIELPPFELGTLMRTFDRDYYSYQGTYDNGDVELPVTWLIDPQLCNVHSQQADEFAALCRSDGSWITSNARRQRSLGSRSVQFHS